MQEDEQAAVPLQLAVAVDADPLVDPDPRLRERVLRRGR
jgi:hypothetical protein